MSIPHRRNILVVDDDSSIRTLLRLVAERRGLTVDLAADGAEALQLLSETRYDLAVVDLMMPRINGYELVASLREASERPTVVVATAMTDSLIGKVDADIVHSIVRKPFDIEIIGSLMAAIVAQNGRTRNEPPAEPLTDQPPPPVADHVC